MNSFCRAAPMAMICTAGAVSLLIAGLCAWTGVDLLMGGIVYPPGTEMSWQVPFLPFVWAAGFLLLGGAMCYYAVHGFWPRS